jgi:uncharacterized membrane protein
MVFAMAAVCLVTFSVGLVRGRPFTRFHRVLGSVFAGLTHLQVTLGIILVAMGRFYPQLIGHLVLMLAAAVVLQVLLIRNRKSASPGFRMPLVGTLACIALMTAGIYAIGRHPFQTTVF